MKKIGEGRRTGKEGRNGRGGRNIRMGEMEESKKRGREKRECRIERRVGECWDCNKKTMANEGKW
jgi:hypothetical protein